jgi:uncharacterized LabA/DUF88 family protein
VTDRSKTVVLLIDWDNLQICHSRDAPGTELDLNAVIALAQSYGTLVSARAYAEWNLPQERLAVYKAGIEPVFAPVMRPEGTAREGKSLADTVMVADGVDLLWTVAPDVFVLVTSDKDMIPLARIAKQRGAAVVILGSDLTAIPLVELSNVFITYRQLVRELDRTTQLDAPSGRAPARERRQAPESRRPSSEPYIGRSLAGSAARSRSRPVEAAPTPVVALPEPAPATANGGTEEPGAAQGEASARRRRRRGGRSRGRGASADGAEVSPEGTMAAESDRDVASASGSEPTVGAEAPTETPKAPEEPSAPPTPLLFREFGPPAPVAQPPDPTPAMPELSPERVGAEEQAAGVSEASVVAVESTPGANGTDQGAAVTGDDFAEGGDASAKPVRRRRTPTRRTSKAAAAATPASD